MYICSMYNNWYWNFGIIFRLFRYSLARDRDMISGHGILLIFFFILFFFLLNFINLYNLIFGFKFQFCFDYYYYFNLRTSTTIRLNTYKKDIYLIIIIVIMIIKNIKRKTYMYILFVCLFSIKSYDIDIFGMLLNKFWFFLFFIFFGGRNKKVERVGRAGRNSFIQQGSGGGVVHVFSFGFLCCFCCGCCCSCCFSLSNLNSFGYINFGSGWSI